MGSSLPGLPFPAAAFRGIPTRLPVPSLAPGLLLVQGEAGQATAPNLSHPAAYPPGASIRQKPLVQHRRPARRCLGGVPPTAALRVMLWQVSFISTSIA